jgi:hypothetical protein
MFDLSRLRSILIEQAILGEPITYASLFQRMGLVFHRARVSALCKQLGEIDEQGKELGETELAVFVVRASDLLPGDGWWHGRRYRGDPTGAKAKAYVRSIQNRSSKYWQTKATSE